MKFSFMKPYRYFLDEMPLYLVRHYWWAYLWPFGVWLFDHQPIINAILFGQYKNLMNTTLARLRDARGENILQLTCVYGQFTPKLMELIAPAPLHIADVAPIQLKLAQGKARGKNKLITARMNAEHLTYEDNSFSTIVLFFLLHELPPEARVNVLSHCMRVIKPGGILLVTEYAPLPEKHFLYRFFPTRWLITRLEPFLDGFWHEDLTCMLNKYGKDHGKKAITISDQRIFSDFYRVSEFRIETLDQ